MKSKYKFIKMIIGLIIAFFALGVISYFFVTGFSELTMNKSASVQIFYSILLVIGEIELVNLFSSLVKLTFEEYY